MAENSMQYMSNNGQQRKVYRTYDKDEYRKDMNIALQIQVDEMNKINPIHKLISKRLQEVPDDRFKGERQINLKKNNDGQQESGMDLLMKNLDKEKQEREAKRKEYINELNRQINEKQNAPYSSKEVALKISQSNPPMLASYRPQIRQVPQTQSLRNYDPPRDEASSVVENNYRDNESITEYRKPTRANTRDEEELYSRQNSYKFEGRQSSGRVLSGNQQSAFRMASKNALKPEPVNTEFFDNNFGRAMERKKQIDGMRKQELVDTLQNQIEEAKDNKRKEKLRRAVEDQKAEERYIKELQRIHEQSVASEANSKPKNNMAEGLTDIEVNPIEVKRPVESAKTRVMESASDTRILSAAFKDEQSIQNKPRRSKFAPHEGSQASRGELTRPRDLSYRGYESERDLLMVSDSRNHLPYPSEQNSGVPQPSHQNNRYSSRLDDYANDQLMEKKRELRMNTNILYKQLIDLRVG